MRRPRILRGTTKDAEQAAAHAPTPAPELPDSHYDSVAWLENGMRFCVEHPWILVASRHGQTVKDCPDCKAKRKPRAAS